MLRRWWDRLRGGRNAYVVQTDKPGDKHRFGRQQRESSVADGSVNWTSTGGDGAHGGSCGSQSGGGGGRFDGGGASGDWGCSSDSGGSSDGGGGDGGGGGGD